MSKLLVGLVFAVCLCASFTSGSTLFRRIKEELEDPSFMRGVERLEASETEDASEIKAASDEDSPSEDKSEKLRPGKLMTRFLEGMTNKVSQASKKAQGLMNKAQEKVKEAKDKASSIPGVDLSQVNIPGVGTRHMDNLRAVMKSYIDTHQDDILNYMSQRSGIPARESDAADLKNERD